MAVVTVQQAAAIASRMIDTPSAAKFALSWIERVCDWWIVTKLVALTAVCALISAGVFWLL